MSFIKIPYDNAKLDAIRVRLENHARVSQPIDYAIMVDDLEIIPRTSDPSLFATIDELIGPTTKYISVSEYIGNTRNRKTTCFMMDAVKPEFSQGLSGIEQPYHVEDKEEFVQKQIQLSNIQREHGEYQRENQRLKEQIQVLLTRCDKLEEDNGELATLHNEDAKKDLILELGKEALAFFTGRKNEGPLAGAQQENMREAEQGNEKNDGQVQYAVPEKEYENYKSFVDQFEKFDSVQRSFITQLLDIFKKYPELIDETFESVFNKTQ